GRGGLAVHDAWLGARAPPRKSTLHRIKRECYARAAVSAESETTPLLASRAARVTLVMSCLYTAAGVTLVFLPRWLEVERGLTGAEIGAVLSLAQLARIITGPAIAHW